MNRTAAINRLLLGRILGAEVKAFSVEHRAWVHIEPIVDPELGRLVNESHKQGEPRLEIFNASEHPITQFTVRFRELHKDFEKTPDDWDLIGLNVDESLLADSIDSLEALLQTRFGLQWPDLQLPHDLDAPF